MILNVIFCTFKSFCSCALYYVEGKRIETMIKLHSGQYWLFLPLINILDFQLEEFLKALLSIGWNRPCHQREVFQPNYQFGAGCALLRGLAPALWGCARAVLPGPAGPGQGTRGAGAQHPQGPGTAPAGGKGEEHEVLGTTEECHSENLLSRGKF